MTTPEREEKQDADLEEEPTIAKESVEDLDAPEEMADEARGGTPGYSRACQN